MMPTMRCSGSSTISILMTSDSRVPPPLSGLDCDAQILTAAIALWKQLQASPWECCHHGPLLQVFDRSAGDMLSN